ncbi:MAG: hypothetical protein L3K08_01055, partial [Thermoplasmata archaeon]|nr:hypothetical protein [Thermoplasmata archaeon]
WSPGTMMRALAGYCRDRPAQLPYVLLLLSAEAAARGTAVVVSLWSRTPIRSWAPIDSTKVALDGGPG